MPELRAIKAGREAVAVLLAALFTAITGATTVLAQGGPPATEQIRPGQLPTASRNEIVALVEGVFDTASKTVSIPIERSLALAARLEQAHRREKTPKLHVVAAE